MRGKFLWHGTTDWVLPSVMEHGVLPSGDPKWMESSEFRAVHLLGANPFDNGSRHGYPLPHKTRMVLVLDGKVC